MKAGSKGMGKSCGRMLISGVIWILIAIVFCIMLPFYVGAFQREPADFRGIKWGSSINDLHGRVLVAEDGSYKFCTLKNDKMQIGNAQVERIVYGFYRDKLFNVMVYYNSLPNFLKLKEVYVQQYGDAGQPNSYLEKYFWNGDNVDLFLSYDDISGEGRISHIYKPIEREIEANEKNEAKNGAQDL
jgi:ABC-type multidrug transport system permease subunit